MREFGRKMGFSALLSLVILCSGAVANAKPEYARKELKACQYCHASASPGYRDPQAGKVEPTTRNLRGQYYETHNHTFQGYVERDVMGKQSPPVFHFVWKEDFTDLPRRVAVGDIAGDGKPRLITLHEVANVPNRSLLRVRKWDGKQFVEEATAEVRGSADKLEVGRFAGSKRPAVIVAEDALYVWDGKALMRRAAGRPLDLLGSARLKDGQERVLVMEGNNEARAYLIAPNAPGNQWLTDPIPAPASSQVEFGDMHGSPQTLDQIGMPNLLSVGGIVGLWDARKFGTLFLYYVKVDQDFDIQADPNNPKSTKPVIKYKDRASYLVFRDPYAKLTTDAKEGTASEIWSTPRLNGVVLDVALENAQGDGKIGLLILTSDSASGKGRSLYFFALD